MILSQTFRPADASSNAKASNAKSNKKARLAKDRRLVLEIDFTAKSSSQSQRDAETEHLKGIDQIIEEIRSNILEIGKKEKEKIIQQGKALADKMIRDAKTYSENRIVAARKELSEEMVDMALSMAKDKLSKDMTDEDNNNLVNQFVTDLQATKLSVG